MPLRPLWRAFSKAPTTEFVDFSNSTASGELPGFKSLRTDSGQPVNYLSKGHYKMVFPEIELTSDDPAAP